MAIVIPFGDIVKARRRRRERESLDRCIEIIRLNLEYNLSLFETAIAKERPVYAERIHRLAALLEYSERIA